jgi:hypothetical protein
MFNILINLNFKVSEVQKYDLVFLCCYIYSTRPNYGKYVYECFMLGECLVKGVLHIKIHNHTRDK